MHSLCRAYCDPSLCIYCDHIQCCRLSVTHCWFCIMSAFAEHLLNIISIPVNCRFCGKVSKSDKCKFVQQGFPLQLSASFGNFSKVFGTNWSLFRAPMWLHATTITFGQHHHWVGHYWQAIVLWMQLLLCMTFDEYKNKGFSKVDISEAKYSVEHTREKKLWSPPYCFSIICII